MPFVSTTMGTSAKFVKPSKQTLNNENNNSMINVDKNIQTPYNSYLR